MFIVPDVSILVTNSSGDEAFGHWVESQLVMLGADSDSILLEQAELEPTSIISATTEAFEAAGYYANLLRVNRNQVTRVENQNGRALDMQIILGQDATSFYGFQQTKEPITNGIEVISN